VAVAAAPETSAEHDAVESLAQHIVNFVRQADPEVTFSLSPPIDPGIWLMYLYVSPDLADDPEFGERVANRAVDVLIEHDVSLATLLRARSRPDDGC